MHGKGLLRQSNGNSFDGTWQRGLDFGRFRVTYANGEIYDGDSLRYRRCGYGVMKFLDGSIYTGEWRDDKCNGEVFIGLL